MQSLENHGIDKVLKLQISTAVLQEMLLNFLNGSESMQQSQRYHIILSTNSSSLSKHGVYITHNATCHTTIG